MLRDTPAWEVVARHRLTQGYGHVRLTGDRVLGQWVCLERRTGRVLWEHDFNRPSAVVGLSGDVIIATERRPVGLMGECSFDCYALQLDTGSLLWTSHPSGQCGDAADEPSWYPDRFDERGAAAAPRLVEDGMCFCDDGRILDPATGRELGRVSPEEVKMRVTRQPADPASALYHSRKGGTWIMGRRCAGVRIAPGRRLNQWEGRGRPFSLRLTADDGRELWTFDLGRHGYEIRHANFYAYRLAGRYVYVVASEPLSSEPPPTPGEYQPPPPRRFHLLTVELEHGTACQDMRIGDAELSTCLIEAVDEEGLLLSSGADPPRYGLSGNVLHYFDRLSR